MTPHHLTVTDEEVVHQAFHVLRLRPDEEVTLLDGHGGEVQCHITEISKKAMECDVVSRHRHGWEPPRRVTMYCAIVKRENFEWAAQKAIEAGASEIVPIVTARTVKTQIKPERIRTIMKEAAEQCARCIVPLLGPTMSYDEAVTDAVARQNASVFFDVSDTDFKTIQLAPESKIGIFIGPEGGWDAKERQTAESLGKLVLRAETAAVIGTFLAVHG